MNKARRKKLNTPFGKNLSLILNERGISQRAAAEMAGVSPKSITDWLSGTIPHDYLAVQRLSKALNCSFEFLLTGENSDTQLSKLPLSELFECEDTPDFSGIFEISMKRLKRRK